MRTTGRIGIVAAPLTLALAALSVPVGATPVTPFIHGLTSISQVSSTVPANGDINPYGVAVVPTSVGQLVAGDVLVSNFNDKANVQGTGTTIVQVAPGGGESTFSHITALPAGSTCPGGIGLTTGLEILPGGWVIVGSLPSKGGALPKNDPAGCLIVLNSSGAVAETFTNPDITGPWDMTAQSTATTATLYVTNALGGNTKTKKGVPVAGQCTVARLDLTLSPSAAPVLADSTLIGTHYPWKANASALVLAPTGLALGPDGTLYVDNSLNDTVSAIPDAGTRTTSVTESASLIAHGGSLSAPLGMIVVPGGDILVVNGNNGLATELSPSGAKVATKVLVKKGGGDLFGLALTPDNQGIYFVNDGTNALDLAQPHQAG